MGLVTHGLEIITSAQLVVSNLPVGRLVVVIPASMTVDLVAAALVTLGLSDALLSRRSLDVAIAGIGNIFHVFLDSVERPAPCVKNHVVAGGSGSGFRSL